MKKPLAIILILVLTASTYSFAQKDSVREKGFNKANLFTGGSLSLAFTGGTFGAGVSPVFGYSVTPWLDAGIGFNYFYISQKYSTTTKVRQHTYGAGPFVRVFPVNFLFAQGQFEKNYIAYRQLYSNGTPTYKENFEANSLLVGAGYSTGRSGEGGSFAYFSVLFDLMDDKYSPYYSQEYLPSGEIIRRRTPVVRAGIHIPLFQGKSK